MSNPESNEQQLLNKSIGYNEIAAKLLQDRYLLTALELHTELVESGREVRQLKDFFSNPGNFELQTQEAPPTRLSRSGSQATLDSLDFTRYSEDGAGTDEKVAVLEFELRKAKETINALRNNLTVATESETSTPDKGSLRNINVGGIKPHEQRALNFLINEYLLLHGYKLTSITFADENQSQDFDDWDDVGLNISKPPELLTLYREGFKQSNQNSASAGTQTENEAPSEKANEMEVEYEYFKTRLNTYEIECMDLKNTISILQKENEMLSSVSTLQNEDDMNHKDLSGNKDSVGSESPESFELIDKNMSIFNKRENSSRLEDNLSNSSFNASDWLNLSIPADIKESESHKETKSINCDIEKISKESFIKEVFSLCYVNLPHKIDNDILEHLLSSTITNESLVHTLSDSLLRIIPNIILNKREEAIPLLICAVYLNPKPSERDKLLQQLFNLKKKPTESERLMILTGLLEIAKLSGENLVENEILPQCWLQLTHKHVERRLLVVEACTTLIPYVSSPIRNSLILSMLQQMLDDKEEIVREYVIKALSLLFALCDDSNKYNQCEQLALNTLNDTNNNIVNISTQILFPILGKWALNEGFLSCRLLSHLLNKLNDYLKNTDSPVKITQSSDKILRIVNVLENLLPFLVVSVATYENILYNIEKDSEKELRSDLKKLCNNLTNPVVFCTNTNPGVLIYEFDKYLAEHLNESWPELDWIVDIMLPDLFNNLHHIEISQQALLHSFMNLFSHICIVFGSNFAKYKIRPLFQTHIQNLELLIASYNQFCPSLNIIPVYLSSILSYCKDYDEISAIFKKFLCALPLCGTQLDCLEVTVRRLCEAELQEIVVQNLWDGVVHPRPLVRAATAGLFSHIIGMCEQSLLRLKITPALVTLASDNDVLVRTATIPALGSLITECTVKDVHDKAYMQLQSYLSDASLRENHTLLRQLIVTLGNIVNSCSTTFRNDVILPQLTVLSAFMSQMSNQTRKVDMALALIEAFTNVVYSPLNKESISTSVMPGLRCLEGVVSENQALATHKDVVLSMLKECDNKVEITQTQNLSDRSNKLSQNVNQGVEEMRQRVSKMFNKPSIPKSNNLANFQSIFKKK